MALKKLPRTRFHKSADGVTRPCEAPLGKCPLGDFDTFEEAEMLRPHRANGLTAPEMVSFGVGVGAPFAQPAQGIRLSSTRTAADRVRSIEISTGHRPAAPMGEIQITLPHGHSILLRRETFDNGSEDGPIGVNYFVKYVNRDGGVYDAEFVELNGRRGYTLLQKYLQNYFTYAMDDPRTTQIDAAIVASRFEQAMRRVSEVEVMSRGAQGAKNVGIDLFQRPDADTLLLEFDYESPLQVSDAVSALGLHAVHDKSLKTLDLRLSGELGSDGSRWNLDRLDADEWYFSVNSTQGMVGYEISDVETLRATLDDTMIAYGERDHVRKATTDFAANFMHNMEGAATGYEITVADRVWRRERGQSEAEKQAKEKARQQWREKQFPSKHGKKLFGLL